MKFHPAGKSIIRNTILIVLLVNVAAWLLSSCLIIGTVVSVASLIVLVLVLQFFRYPNRTVSLNDKNVISPADGTICVIEECEEKDYLKTTCKKVSIFMSPLNVHINWVPVPGTVSFLEHREGHFYAAFKDKSADENERTCMAIRMKDGREIMANQVAGAMARRILNFLHVGQVVSQDMEMGFIRFGSRVDLYLPLDTEIQVKLGDKVTGSQTIIGKLK
ncbi:phosphatidylserine decarboxylase family protein [uncultured Sunxiuqinia sp.]|uniref:phosphatidylserine decarboxylase family protein n=1 Tax=uncultured Sunxiuqinia sp. TaxID=1573825 RepID=UPI00260AA5AD|nr:phosphatidylserine decarboxylase family protein [uncultured Sunxiuqinia sp.]